MTFLSALLGRGKALAAMARAALQWVLADARRWLALLLLAACLTAWWQASRADAWRERAASWEQRAGAERAAHQRTIARYRAAAAEAERRARANRDNVEARWRAQYEEAVNAKSDLQRDYRARAARWVRDRADPAAGDRGAPGRPDLPAPAAVPGRAVPDAATAVVPVSDIERCADAYAQLAALIGWVAAAQAVDTGSGASAPAGRR